MKMTHARARAASALVVLALAAAGCSDDAEPRADRQDAPSQPDGAPDPEATADPGTADAPPTTTEAPATTEAPPTTTEAPATTEAPPATTDAPPTTTEAPGPPHTAELAWGDFALAERIAAKLEAGDPLNFVVSITATGDAGPAGSLEHGWRQAAAEAAEAHGAAIDARVIGPHRADAEAQASTITDLVATGDIDCLAVEAANERLLDGAIDAAVDAGVPVFAVGGDSPDSKRFAFYGPDDYAAGLAAGRLVGQWAADGGILVRRAGVVTGDAGRAGLFDRMRGFVDGLTEIHSGVEFVNGPADAESFGFDPVEVYNRTEAWVLENSDVDIVFHTDRGLEHLAEAMAEHLLYGDMHAVGFHISGRVADFIRERLVVAAMVEGLSAQARLAGLACADFLLGGVHSTGHVVVEPVAVTLDSVDDADWSLPESR